MKIFKIFLFTAIFVALLPFAAFADTNVDGGGGDMGEGTGTNIWHVGDDGVRITVVRDSDNAPVSQSINFTNILSPKVEFHGGLINKKIFLCDMMSDGKTNRRTINKLPYKNP